MMKQCRPRNTIRFFRSSFSFAFSQKMHPGARSAVVMYVYRHGVHSVSMREAYRTPTSPAISKPWPPTFVARTQAPASVPLNESVPPREHLKSGVLSPKGEGFFLFLGAAIHAV